MEENIAIMMADLSGYTALTETHGAVTAADLIDKYLQIVQSSLVGDSELKERTGDEVMIVSGSPDNLLSTAIMIINNTSSEQNFLQVHGGLHYGKVLKRKDSYFGSAINITSRLVGKASPGTFWCSLGFMEALTNKSKFTFEQKGKHNLKNIAEEIELFEVANVDSNAIIIDPVCRMLIQDKSAAIQHPGKPNFFFCSEGCLQTFMSNH